MKKYLFQKTKAKLYEGRLFQTKTMSVSRLFFVKAGKKDNLKIDIYNDKDL